MDHQSDHGLSASSTSFCAFSPKPLKGSEPMDEHIDVTDIMRGMFHLTLEFQPRKTLGFNQTEHQGVV
jgi:hypothetical protein